jgi:hypothetical protein
MRPLFLMLVFALGVLLGETYAPISGTTVSAISRRCAQLELTVSELMTRTARLEMEAGSLRLRVQAWLPNADL